MEWTRFPGWTPSATAEDIREALGTKAAAPTYRERCSQCGPTAKKAKSTAFPLLRDDKPRVLKKFDQKTRAEQAAARARATAGGDHRAKQDAETNRRTRNSAARRAAAHAKSPLQMEKAFENLSQLINLEEKTQRTQKAAEH
ncbi:unnamed protein product [Prorocentrum cordatum]|uniref:Uncharacterized protein n=1 Tax=Prorocentrum cordatum TaxID=2364126 RepID=A0ABN9U613_9DINO|nr:unnamed protein product [Polarella glacialis]